eukprot:XP_001702334.1 predicted protein [Chlamydomonas reinhardtii]
MLLSRGSCTTSGRCTTTHLPAVLGQARLAWSRRLAHAKAGVVGNWSCVAAGSKVYQRPTEESARLDSSGPPGRGPPADFHAATRDGGNGPNGPSGPRHQQGGWLQLGRGVHRHLPDLRHTARVQARGSTGGHCVGRRCAGRPPVGGPDGVWHSR